MDIYGTIYVRDCHLEGNKMRTVRQWISKHNNVTGDCHNPAGLPILLQQEWRITVDGIIFYPPGFRENYSQLEIRMPWKDLDPYLRGDVKTKLPMNK